MNSTLSKVQQKWSGQEGKEIARCIDFLERDPRVGILCLVTNKKLGKEMKRIANSSSESLKKAFINLYRRLTSEQFMKLLDQLHIDGKELKQKILKDLSVIEIFKNIEAVVRNALKPREANTSVVYLSAENVQRSQIIEHSGIDSYESILRNFEDFKALEKDSASDSIIFTAKLKDTDNMIIPLVNPFYFKVYPTGSTRSYDFSKAGFVDVEHDTSGLEFEEYAYTELFKLMEYNVTPNILCKAATSSNITGFDILLTAIPVDRKVQFMKQIQVYNDSMGIEPDTKIWEETSVIITQPGGNKFHEKIKLLTPNERKQVMFQLIYTLYVFEKIQFSHGDLHTGNIFIVDIPETEMIYIVNGQQYRFKTKKMVKIYDFDHGTICKRSEIKINTDESFMINEKLNPIRNDDEYFNIHYAETNIFNKNLDIVILLNALISEFPDAHDSFTAYDSFTCFEDVDRGFDKFFRDCFPGFDSVNPLSRVTVYDTYSDLLTRTPELLDESNRIFGIDIADESEIDFYGISGEIMNMTWLQYFKKLGTKHGRIVKNLKSKAENNNLWIPDTIIIPKEDMFKKDYFTSLESSLPIDIRYQLIYTLDGRLL
jgi:hypothetical protein